MRIFCSITSLAIQSRLNDRDDHQDDDHEGQPPEDFEKPVWNVFMRRLYAFHRRGTTGFLVSKLDIFRPDFQAFILVFPDGGGIGIQKLWRDFATSAREQLFRLLRRVFVGRVVISRAAALVVVPMRDGMDGFVLLRPRFDFGANVGGNFIERHERFVAMLADEAGLAHVAREQRQKRRSAARRFRVAAGGVASRLNQICFSCAICAASR